MKTDSVNRRSFLGGSLVAGGAVLLSSAHVGADDAAAEVQPVRVGIMGVSRGRSLASTFGKQPGVTLKYLCDVDETRVNAAVESVKKELEHQSPTPISDFRQILDDPEIDVLVCAAPNHWHAPATILACNAGKHVYVEKPCSHNPWEGETMVAAARKHNRCVQMGTQRRSSAAYQEAIRLLQQEQVIGRVYLSRAWYNNLRPSIGKGNVTDPPAQLNFDLWQGPAPRVPFKDNLLHYNWHWHWDWGNGELGNNGVHSLDICRWGLGVDYPTRVTSSGGRYRWEDDQETPDTHTVAYEFEGKRQITWEGLSCNKHAVDGGFVTFFGEEGTLALGASGAFKVYDRSDAVVQEHKAQLDDADHVRNFLTCVREQTPQKLNAEIETGHISTMLCHLGNIAQRSGLALECDPTNGHITNAPDTAKYWKRSYANGWEPKVT
ncbi:MAG: Gfo/Idh/MocA family oxidoreductase [Planctomycetaceae bacterium]